jgi:hypothetical protein
MCYKNNKMYQKSNIKINLTGGLISPTDFLNILDIARHALVEAVRFGARQQLLMTIPYRAKLFFERKMAAANLVYETDMQADPTITSSFAFANILQNTTSWVSEGVYFDIFNLFDYKPHLKINICDSSQSHAPFFTGHLNFISAETPHFWYCYIRLPKTNTIERFPKLVYTQSIAVFAKQLEVLIEKNILNIQNVLSTDFETDEIIFRQIEQDLTIPRFMMPYYEGINIQSENKLWLGIYRRHETFSVEFLMEVCQLCEATRIGNICITNWRSLIIKDIPKADRLQWEKLLGKYGINVRHATNELNWQTEDDSAKGFKIKQYLVKAFDELDARTYGLVFAVKTRHKSEVFGSVIIRREPLFKIGKYEFDGFGLLGSYNIFYAEDFNPHTRKRKTFKTGLSLARLPEALLSLTKKYYRELATVDKALKIKVKQDKHIEPFVEMHTRCRDCWTVLEPQTLICPTCEAEIADFEQVTLPS